MTTTTLVPADWLAAGVRNEILMRVLPTLRHDLLGPISVARMELAVMRRRLERSALELQDGLRRVQQLDSHLVDLTRGLRDLRRWDSMTDERMAPGAIVALAIGLMEQPLRLAGITVELDRVDDGEGEPRSIDALLLGTLAMLCHAQDHLPAGSRLQVRLETSEARLSLHAIDPADVSEPAAPMMDLPRVTRVCVDAEAVRHLAASLGLHAVLDARPWLLRPAEGMSASNALNRS